MKNFIVFYKKKTLYLFCCLVFMTTQQSVSFAYTIHQKCYFESMQFIGFNKNIAVFKDLDNEKAQFFIGENIQKEHVFMFQKQQQENKIDLYICGAHAVIGVKDDTTFTESSIDGAYTIKELQQIILKKNIHNDNLENQKYDTYKNIEI